VCEVLRSASVCLSYCISQKRHVHVSYNFLYMLPVAVGRFSSNNGISGFVDDTVFSYNRTDGLD